MLVFRYDQNDFTDLFCGLEGSTKGLKGAGLRLRLAMNHSGVQVAAHRANHPEGLHLTEDINAFDKRSLPRTRILWGSPICTEISTAGGRRRTRGQTCLIGADGSPTEDDGMQPQFERTRATALDIIAATEVHRYDAVLGAVGLVAVRDGDPGWFCKWDTSWLLVRYWRLIAREMPAATVVARIHPAAVSA
ncbi:DNA cytosine methyltransferase [Streptomyces sp. NPDC005859]|uniref:DNA cytosine methyltransferase n=1 Tax=Streptomyces sp. NPDC005859 TaxID=3157170 RepID=UPI0034024E0D